MPKKTKLGEEEVPVTEKPQIEDLLAEKQLIEEDEERKSAVEAKKTEEEAAIPEVEVDLEEERERTKKETIEAVSKEIVEPLKQQIIDLKQTLTVDEKDDYDKFVDDYTEKNGKAPEWKQVATFLEDRAVQRVKEDQKAQEDLAAEEDKKQKETQESQAQENFKVWQAQLEEMESKGMLPKMEKPEEGDAGFDARVQLYGHMQATWKSAVPLNNLWEVYAKYWTQETKKPAGADAPISMGSGGGSEEDAKDYKYSEIRNGGKDLEAFILRELQKSVGK